MTPGVLHGPDPGEEKMMGILLTLVACNHPSNPVCVGDALEETVGAPLGDCVVSSDSSYTAKTAGFVKTPSALDGSGVWCHKKVQVLPLCHQCARANRCPKQRVNQNRLDQCVVFTNRNSTFHLWE